MNGRRKMKRGGRKRIRCRRGIKKWMSTRTISWCSSTSSLFSPHLISPDHFSSSFCCCIFLLYHLFFSSSCLLLFFLIISKSLLLFEMERVSQKTIIEWCSQKVHILFLLQMESGCSGMKRRGDHLIFLFSFFMATGFDFVLFLLILHQHLRIHSLGIKISVFQKD